LHTKSYDAFGKPRNGDWSDMAGGLFQAKLDFSDTNGTIDLTKRGFTDHEHLDEMQLIHMNGRMYDYNNGRFLSVDPFVQAPTSTQSMNPYTYILNNPLSGVDPSGYRFISLVANVIRLGGRYAKRGFRELKRSRSEERKPTIESPPYWGPNGDIPGPPPILPQPSNPTGPSKTTSPTVDNFGSKTESPIADQTTPNNTANDNGNQNSNQGTMMNENSGDNSDIENQSDNGNSSAIDTVLEGIEENGFGVNINENKPETQQEGNATIDFNDGTKVNIRVETHPLKQGGENVRHANVEQTKKVKNKNKVTEKKHIKDEEKPK
jgi:RHS repeat-associated protein